MDILFTILHYVSGPVLGALIGAFTNFLAIKMLFRPLKPVKIGKLQLPFTPGVIPRHQEPLAVALSNTVYNNFFSNADIEGIFMSDEMAESFAGGIYDRLEGFKLSDITGDIPEEDRAKVKDALYKKIHELVLDTDIESIVTVEARKLIDYRIRVNGLSKFLMSDKVTENLAQYIGKAVSEHVREHDTEILYPILTEQGESLEQKSFAEIAASLGADREMAVAMIKRGYLGFMKDAKSTIAETFHIKEFIYNKMMELDPADIERIVNEAIKKEMNYLVYLGGLLGFLIGIINIFI